MTTQITGTLRDGATPVALSPMNGRGDTLGITLLKDVLREACADTPWPTRGDTVWLLPVEGAGPDLRVFCSTEAVEAADGYSWSDVTADAVTRTVVYMNSRQDTIGVSLPQSETVPSHRSEDAVIAPGEASGQLELFLPNTDE